MSGFQEEDLDAFDQRQVDAAAATNAIASLQAGHPFSLLLADDDRQRASELETLLDVISDTATRFSRATNPLRARLTLERLLIQVIQGGPDATQADPATLIRRIAQRRSDETRVILVIERSETLHPEVLQFFGQTASLFPDGVPRLQVLFVGRSEFQRMLADPDAGFDEQTEQLEAYRPREVVPLMPAVAEIDMEPLPPRIVFQDHSLRSQMAAVWNRGLGVRMMIVGGTVIGAAAVTFAVLIALSGNDGPVQVDTGTALLEMPEPEQSDPDPPVLQPGPAPDEATAQLRREFEAYLTASGRDIQNATSGQKRAIYQEFLVWRARTQGGRGPG